MRRKISKLLSKKSLVTKVAKTQGVWSEAVTPDDNRWMSAAIAASWRAVGRSGINPPVGCALVSRDGNLLAVGHTGRGGVPHAEVSALQSLCNAGRSALQGGTAYVTLEPCSHHGKTPPCSDALIPRWHCAARCRGARSRSKSEWSGPKSHLSC